MVVLTADGPGDRDAEVDHGVPPDQPPAGLPGVRSGGGVLPADLLHEARPLRSRAWSDEKVHKPKAVPLGPHVILDAERCILCSRCVRFCDEITGTGELGIFNRGDHSEIGLFPGQTLENKYSGNVVDICPVGALTDRDFRFQVRVWYLDTDQLDLSGMRARLQHRRPRQPPASPPRRGPSGGPPQAALQRGGEPLVDLRRRPLRISLRRRRTRLLRPTRGAGAAAHRTSAGTRRSRPSPPSSATRRAVQLGVIASPRMANEDLFALRRLLELARDPRASPSVCRPRIPGDQDDFLIRADKNPNTRGAELIGLDGDAAGILAAARAGRLRHLWVFGTICSTARGRRPRWRRPLAALETLVFTGTNANWTSARAHLVLPAAAWVERDGHLHQLRGPRAAFPAPRSIRSARRGRRGRSSGSCSPCSATSRRPRGPSTGSASWRRRCPPSAP